MRSTAARIRSRASSRLSPDISKESYWVSSWRTDATTASVMAASSSDRPAAERPTRPLLRRLVCRAILGFGPLQAVLGGPVVQMHVDVDEPVVVDRQEVFQIVSAAMPPVIDVAVLKPAEAQAHVDGRDESLPGQRLLCGRHHPGFQAPLAVRLHEGERSRPAGV